MEKVIMEGKISGVTLLVRLLIDCCAMIILIGIIWFVKDLIKFFTTKLTITDSRIKGKTGLVNTNQLDSPLNKINGIQVQQGLFGKLFNYGTICIVTASTSINYDYISNPNEFRNVLNNQIEKYDEERIEKQAKKMAEAMK